MAIKAMIRRKFKSGTGKDLGRLLNELRSKAIMQDGYISGETLVSAEDPKLVLVVSSWVSPSRWEAWLNNEERIEGAKEIEKYLEEPERIEVFLSGEKIPEWVDMA
jgi:heme-degrading monooxygenase HmoA